jgi:hypothetical protein
MMNYKTLSSLLIACAFPAVGHSAAVDLSTWTAQNWSAGAGNWVVQPGGASVLQTINGQPTVFLSGESALGTDIQGKIKVETTSDDDFIGFVLGFESGDFASASADYLLIDWKQGNQSGADAGLAVSRVTGIVPAADPGFWEHTTGVTELARGANLGSTGWADNVEYNFGFIFTATSLHVLVNGVEEINIAGAFSGGNLGFYNYSQSTVRYSGFTQDTLPSPVPEVGSTLALLGLSLAGMSIAARGKK